MLVSVQSNLASDAGGLHCGSEQYKSWLKIRYVVSRL